MVCRWIRAWEKGGEEAIQLGLRGRTSEEQRKLTKEQEQALLKIISDKNPQQLKLSFALWTRKAILEWLTNAYPKLKQQAKREGGEIYWGDETGMRNDCQHSRGYAPKGKTPVVEVNAKRFSTNMISAINNRGAMRFMIYRETMTARVLICFMRRLVKDAKRKVFLILENLLVHHAHLGCAWLEKNKAVI